MTALHAAQPIASEARDATARPYAGRHRVPIPRVPLPPPNDGADLPKYGPSTAIGRKLGPDEVPDGIGWGHD